MSSVGTEQMSAVETQMSAADKGEMSAVIVRVNVRPMAVYREFENT